jgi:integrase
LRALPREDNNPYLFVGPTKSAGLSNMAMAVLLRRMGRGDITVHGFRSTFRDWAAERTTYPNHVVEMALAHAIGSKVEKAYRRGDLFEKRRRLMAEWAKFATSASTQAEVIGIREARTVS